MLKRNDLRIRDPFVVLEGGRYYMTGTDFAPGVIRLYESADMENWEEPTVIFALPSEPTWIDAAKDLWAPEIHRYHGRFYLFFSPCGKSGRRGTQIAVADCVSGPYRMVKNGPATPKAQSCIDGTLYVEGGTPYIVYSHDWPDCLRPGSDIFEGEIAAVALDENLCEAVGEPFILFRGGEPGFTKTDPVNPQWGGRARFGTDAPFLHRTPSGKLLLLWSPYFDKTYFVFGALSEGGSIRGPWHHQPKPIFADNGGHAMLFHDPKDGLSMAIHCPETYGRERLRVLRAEDRDDTLVLHE